MANPITVDCPVNVWTPLATNVLIGTVKILEPNAGYHFTYRATGDPAPVSGDFANVQRCDLPRALIMSEFEIDVYCYCPTGTQGRVEVSV